MLTNCSAEKYKLYSRLRAEASSSNNDKLQYTKEKDKSHKSQSSPRERELPKKRKLQPTQRDSQQESTPKKVSKHEFFTPQKNTVSNLHPSQLDPYDSPSALRRLFSPSHHKAHHSSPLPLKEAIGPTPQRDGKALGLFDLLSPSTSSIATPSSKRKLRTAETEIQTPSRPKEPALPGEDGDNTIRIRRLSSTPSSSTKRYSLANFFATPTTLRYANADDYNLDKTPQSKESDTPSFLRRRNMPLFKAPRRPDGSANEPDPITVRMPQKFVGKGLSQLVQGLRDMEDEKLDEDFDTLNEIEAEQQNNQAATQRPDDPEVTATPTKRTWKKRGQKRTTRRVTMRPLRSKPRPEPEWKVLDDVSEDESAAVPETQVFSASNTQNQESGSKGAGDENASEQEQEQGLVVAEDDSEFDPGSPCENQTKEYSANSIMAIVVNNKGDDKASAIKDQAPEKKQARKIKPEAHANYRALRIRNKGTRGRGRFGRGRR